MKYLLHIFFPPLILLLGNTNSLWANPSSDDVGHTAIAGEKKIAVKTAQGLTWVAQETNKGKNSGYNGFLGYTIELTDDIDLGECEWTPIGTDEAPFRGSFNGAGYNISNIKIGSEKAGSDKKFIGLFGYIMADLAGQEIKIENVTLRGGDIYGGKNTEYAGALAGYIYSYGFNVEVYITVNRCSSSVNVAGEEAFCSYTGGLIGGGEGKGEVAGFLVIEYCTNSGMITGGGTSNSYTGGIIGSCKGVGEGLGKGDGFLIIRNCINSGGINGTGTSVSYTGGITGYGSGSGEGYGFLSVKNCINGGIIKGADAPSSYTAGIAGYGYGYGDDTYGYGSFIIENCANNGKITGGNSYSSTGGIVGEAYSNGYNDGMASLTIESCTNCGEITGRGTSSSYTGGIIGMGYAEGCGSLKISACYSDCLLKPSAGFAGGLAGWLQCRNADAELFIITSYAAGSISGRARYTGGVVGGMIKIEDNYPIITNCIVLMESLGEGMENMHRIIGAAGTTSDNVSMMMNDISFDNYFVDKQSANIAFLINGANPENTENSWKTLEGETWNGEKPVLFSKFKDSSWSIDASEECLPRLSTRDGVEHPRVPIRIDRTIR